MSFIYPSYSDWTTFDRANGLLYSHGRLCELVYPELWEGCVCGIHTQSDFRDWSKLGNHGTNTSGVLETTEYFHTGSSSGYVAISDDDSLDVANITISMWIRTTDGAGTTRRYFAAKSPGSGTSGFMFNKENAANFMRIIVGTGSLNQVEWGDATTFDGIWHHHLFTYDGTDIVAYRDGDQQASSSPSAGDMTGGTEPLHIGEYAGGGTGNTIDAEMAYFQMYNRAISKQEIASQCENWGTAWLIRPLRRYFVSGGAPPTGSPSPRTNIQGPLVGPFGGPINA